MENRTYFKKIHRDYLAATDFNAELYSNISGELNRILHGTVIDFGNGGVINYDIGKIDRLICADIIYPPERTSAGKIDCVYGDFYNIELDCRADFILIQFLIHHLTDDEKLEGSFRRLGPLLKAGGRLIVVEMEFPYYLENMQTVFRPFLFKLLSFLNKPHLRFFSSRSIERLLIRTGFAGIRRKYIPIGKRVSPAPVLFPNLRIPGKLYPFRCVLFEAKKQKR